MSVSFSNQPNLDQADRSPSLFLPSSGVVLPNSGFLTGNSNLHISFDSLDQSAASTLGSAQQVETVSRGVFDYLIAARQSVVNCFLFFLRCLGRVKIDVEPTDIHTLEYRLLKNDTQIAKALKKQSQCNKKQMKREPVKPLLCCKKDLSSLKVDKVYVGDTQVGIAYAQGKRLTMEDEHIAKTFDVQIGQRVVPIQLYGIFDGHNGSMAAKYVRDQLEKKLSEALVEHNPTGLTKGGIWRALKMTFVGLNSDFREKSEAAFHCHGTTATIAMIVDQQLWTANVGDSRTILDNGGKAEQLTEDAKPNNPRYSRGIERRNGTVENIDGVYRVNGKLAVARAIGDLHLKGAMSARSKIAVKSLSEISEDSHLVLGCDGVFDVCTTVDVVHYVHRNSHLSPDHLAREIINGAYQAGSQDNLSVIVVKIRRGF